GRRAADGRGRREPRRESEHRARAPPGGRAGAGRARPREARALVCRRSRAFGGHRHARRPAAARDAHRRRRAALRARLRKRRLDRGELQGRPARAHARGRARHRRGGCLSRPHLPREGREPEPGHRLAVLGAPRGECDRELGEGRAARARPPRARRARSRTSAPCAPQRGLITLSVMLASIMQALDNTIANVALPRIQGSLSATQDQMAWVLTSYIVAAAIMTPLSGWLAGQVGRKRVFIASVIGFTVFSALCGLARTLPEIVL